MSHFNILRKLTGGLTALSLLVASVPTRAAEYAPIDYSKASSPAERTICRSYLLGQAEARMAILFGVVTSLVAMGNVAILQDQLLDQLKQIPDIGYGLAYQNLLNAANERLNRPLKNGFRMEGQLTTAKLDNIQLLADGVSAKPGVRTGA